MKKRLSIRILISIALMILVSSRLGIVQSAEGMHAIQLIDYPLQIKVGDLIAVKGWVAFTQFTTNYPVYAVLVIEGSKMQCSAKWLPEGTVPETAAQLGTYTYDGNIHWVWYVPEIDNGVAYTIYALDRETAKIKSNTLTYTVGGGTVDMKPTPPPLECFNFSITSTSSSILIQQGRSGSVCCSIMLLGGTAQTVTLFLSGLPSGCTYSLDPSSGMPPFSSTLIVNVGASTTAGSYPLTVTGIGSSLTRRSSLSLIVTASVPLTYSLIVTTQPSGIVMWQGADSYSAGSIVHLGTAPETVEGGPGIRYVFRYWKVDDVQVYDNPLTITMDRNHAAVAIYKTQYYLTVQSAQATPSQSSGYQDANSRITVFVPETVNRQYDSRYICKSYLLDDASQSGNSACVTMDKPHNLTFVWTLQFYLILTCTIIGPSLLGENWYDYGAIATVQAAAAFPASDGKQYQFYQWVSTGVKTPHLADPYASTTTLVMNSSGYQLEAQYNETMTNQYQLNIGVFPVVGGLSTPLPGCYLYDSGSSVTVIETPATGYEFDHWDLDGSNVGSNPNYTVVMEASHTLTAIFRTVTIVRGIQTIGTNFTLNGKNIRLTGIHMIAWPDSDTRYKDTYFDWLKNWNIDTIILDFGWNFVEPAKGVYDQEYLNVIDRFIAKAKARGIYVVPRMHKWSYPSAYQADYPPWPNSWILGYPTWIGHTPDFWENDSNCWDSYIAMWTMLADRYKNDPYVAGFDLCGEPGTDIGPGIYDPPGVDCETWKSNTCRKVMGVLFDEYKLYERTINAIHSISDKFVIIEGFAYGVLSYLKNVGDTERTTAQRPNSENFAVGQSVYEWCQFEWLDGQKSVTDGWNVPYIATEFGVKVAVIDSPEPERVAWVEQACQEFYKRNMSWFYWHFGPGPNGDYNLVNEVTDSVSPLLSNTLATYTFRVPPAP